MTLVGYRKRVRSAAGVEFSRDLRAIAQDLEMRDIKTFDLRCERGEYIVHCGYQSPPAPTPVTLHYTPDDVDQLDREGHERRSEAAQPNEFFSLSHVLRGIGWYMENKKARLLRVSNNDSPGTDAVFRIEYETEEGEHVVDDRPASAVYDICVNMYKQRGKMPVAFRKYASWQG